MATRNSSHQAALDFARSPGSPSRGETWWSDPSRSDPSRSSSVNGHYATASRSPVNAGTPRWSRNIDVVTVVTVNDEPHVDPEDDDEPPAHRLSPSRLWRCIPAVPPRHKTHSSGAVGPRPAEATRLAAEFGQLRTTVQKLERRVDELEDSLDSVGGRLLETLALLGGEIRSDGLMAKATAGGLFSEKKAGRPTHSEAIVGGEAEDDAVNMPFPEGGRRAWLVAAGAACLLFSTMGYGNSFGVFQAYYEGNQLRQLAPGQIAWIGSTQSFLMFAGGFVGGPMFDCYGAGWVIPPASLVYLLALMLTSLCTQYYQFMLTQGILTGLAQGFLIFPAMAAVAQYFDQKRGAAIGLVVAGASVGAVVFPVALSAMLRSEALGYEWALRVLGLAVAPLLLFASCAVRARLPPRRKRLFVCAAFRNLSFLALVAAFVFVFLGMFTPLFFVPTFAVRVVGMSSGSAATLVAVVNAASFFGRVGPGMLADRYGRLNVLACAAVATGVVTLCWTLAATTARLHVFAVFFGFFSGAVVSGGSVVFALTADCPKNIGTYIGMGMPLASFAQLVGPPINGVLLAGGDGFLAASIFSGVMCIVGGVVVVFVKTRTPQGVLGLV